MKAHVSSTYQHFANALAPAPEQTKSTVQSILNSIEQYVKVSQGDAYLVAGSHLEGFGDDFSDVDVHVVCDKRLAASTWRGTNVFRMLSPDRSLLTIEDAHAEVFIAQYCVHNSYIKVDTEYRTFEEVDRLVTDIASIFNYARTNLILLTKTISPRDMAFVHRLFSCNAVRGNEYFDSLRERVSKDAWCYLLYRWKATDYSVLLDILGAMRSEDAWRAVDLARENLLSQFQALTHIAGNTNYRRKWVFRYAENLGISSDIINAVKVHLSGPSEMSLEGQLGFVGSCLKLSETLIKAAIPHFRRLDVPQGLDAIGMLDAQGAGASPYAILEREYRKLAYHGSDLSFEWLIA